MSKPLISVIVPLYNTEKYLDECVSSIISQTYSNLEILLIDDGSTDSSPKICDTWAKKDERIKVIHQKNAGQAAAYNAALDIAQGELIGFVDSDDYIAPDMYEKLYDLMINYDSDMSVVGYDYVHEEDGRVVKHEDSGKPLEIVSGKQALIANATTGTYGGIFLWDKLYRAELFKELRFPVGNRHPDTALMHRLLGSCKKVAVSYEPLYHYRVRSGSTMGTIRSKNFNVRANVRSWQDHRAILKDRYEYLDSLGMNDLAEFVKLVTYNYSIMISILKKVNYFQYRQDIAKFMGCSPLQLAAKLIFSCRPAMIMRGVKLLLLWVKSMFNPKVEYVPLTQQSE